jgi:malate dehydrogenase (oxaloacetate-decarboxylating)(NADP+)
VFPPLGQVRDISLTIATAVADVAFDSGLAAAPRPVRSRTLIETQLYDPGYPTFV